MRTIKNCVRKAFRVGCNTCKSMTKDGHVLSVNFLVTPLWVKLSRYHYTYGAVSTCKVPSPSLIFDHPIEELPHLLIKFWMAWRWHVSLTNHRPRTRINSLGAPIGSVWKNNLIGRKLCSARMQWTANFIHEKVNVLSIWLVHHWQAKCQYQVLPK